MTLEPPSPGETKNEVIKEPRLPAWISVWKLLCISAITLLLYKYGEESFIAWLWFDKLVGNLWDETPLHRKVNCLSPRTQNSMHQVREYLRLLSLSMQDLHHYDSWLLIFGEWEANIKYIFLFKQMHCDAEGDCIICTFADATWAERGHQTWLQQLGTKDKCAEAHVAGWDESWRPWAQLLPKLVLSRNAHNSNDLARIFVYGFTDPYYWGRMSCTQVTCFVCSARDTLKDIS